MSSTHTEHLTAHSLVEKKPTGRGGPGRGQGRKPLVEGVQTVIVPVRLTPDQKEKFHALGGADWFRRTLDRAKLPKERTR